MMKHIAAAALIVELATLCGAALFVITGFAGFSQPIQA